MAVTLNGVANNVEGWVAMLMAQGIDLSTNGHLKCLAEAQEYADDQSLEEAADVFISLVASLASKGWSPSDLAAAAEKKMQLNRQRRWVKKEDGTYQHWQPLS